MSESERTREEQDELDNAHGKHLLDVTDYARRSQRQERREDPLVEILNRAHQAKAEDDKE
jgi:hypothetical protein